MCLSTVLYCSCSWLIRLNSPLTHFTVSLHLCSLHLSPVYSEAAPCHDATHPSSPGKWCSEDRTHNCSFSKHDKLNYCQRVQFLCVAKTERKTKREKWCIYQKRDTWASCSRCNTNKYRVLQHRHELSAIIAAIFPQ